MKSKNPISRSMASKYAKREKRWTLLFIGNHGRTITFYRTKEALFIAISVLVLLGAGIGTLAYFHRKEVQKNTQIQEKMDNLKKVLTDLRNENEVLLARLVLAESRVEEKLQSKAAESNASTQNAKTLGNINERTAQPSKSKQMQDRVAIDDFVIYHEPDMNTLQVQYKVVNSGPKNESVAGRTVVVLKTSSANPSNWLVLPKVPLKKGRPTGKYGKSFSIFKFRTMKFKANDQTGPDQFNTGIVYVFSKKGELMVEKDFPVGIKTKVITSTKKKVKKAPDVKRKEPKTPPEKKEIPPATKPVTPVVEKPAEKPKSSTPTPAPTDEQASSESSDTPADQPQTTFQLQIPSADQPAFSLPEQPQPSSGAGQPNQTPSQPAKSRTSNQTTDDEGDTSGQPE